MVIQSWIKKTKGALSFARMFSTYNKRFFTLNLEKILFYYSDKANYEYKDIRLVPVKVFIIPIYYNIEFIFRIFKKLSGVILMQVQMAEIFVL